MLIKDLIFNQELQDSLSMAAQSKRTGEAKVIAARAEVESAKLMRRYTTPLSIHFLYMANVKITGLLTFYHRHQPCKSDTSRPCKQWPSPRTQRSSSCQDPPTRVTS
jgi:hypothetical protein